VVDTLGNAYLQQSAITSASATDTATVRKKETSTAHSAAPTTFFSVALETLGPMSVSTQEFLAQIRRRLTEVTTDPRETMLLFQRLSIIVQRFNVGMPS